jgi:hypothetical protein
MKSKQSTSSTFAGIKGRDTLTTGELQFEGINDFNY